MQNAKQNNNNNNKTPKLKHPGNPGKNEKTTPKDNRYRKVKIPNLKGQ